MNNKPLISIVVPIYNAERYLKRCILSIINQTYFNWELLLIDDGSVDSSACICKEFASQTNRVKYFYKNNGGVSSARNLGIYKSKGDFITFIDADDFVDPSFLMEMIARSFSDLIICGFEILNEKSFIPEDEDFLLRQEQQKLVRLFDIPFYLDTPWCKLFKKSIITRNNLFFDTNMRLSEDTLFCYNYILHCESISAISKSLYFYDGKWGGDSKYSLTYSELEYMSSAIVNAISTINKKFKSSIDSRYKCFHISKLKNLFTDYSDVDIYELYNKTHNPITISEFLGDSRISPLTVGILRARILAMRQAKEECLSLLQNLNRFFSTPITLVKFKSKKTLLFYLALKVFGYRFIYIILKRLYYK